MVETWFLGMQKRWNPECGSKRGETLLPYNEREDGIVGVDADKCLGMGLCRNVGRLSDGLLQGYLVSHSPL